LEEKGKFTLLGEIFITGNEGTVDLTSLRPRRKAIVRLFFSESSESSVIFALIDFCGVPRFLSNELVGMVCL
jgi:hypothetical protein